MRADQVGSLLRPAWLEEERARFKRGEVAAARLRAAGDRAITEVVRKQEGTGLQSITDGEFRRGWWHLDFLAQLDGVALKANPGPKFHVAGQGEQPPIATVTGRIGCSRPIMTDDFAYLKSQTTRTPKMTIRSPSMLHLRLWSRGHLARGLPRDGRLLRRRGRRLPRGHRRASMPPAAATCSWTTSPSPTLCGPQIQANCRANADDPAALPQTYADTINSGG